MILNNRVQDKKPYIEVKDAIVARSGMYVYTREEILARGHKPAQVKDFYTEFRPAAVVAAAIGLFDLVPVPNKEHTDVEITSENFHEHVSGMVGGPITVVPMPNGVDIGLKGKIAFFTKDAYDYYMAGNRETSADYTSESVLVDKPEETGYDLIMTKITSVNNVAITSRGRGGKDVRIQDSAPVESVIDKIIGRNSMGALTSFLGLNKPEKFAATVKDSLVRAKTLDAEGRGKEFDTIYAKVAEFTDSPIKSALIGVVRDSFVHLEAVLDKWKESEVLLDKLYARCIDSDAALASQVTDTDDEKKKKDKEDADKKEADEKASREKDAAAAAAAGTAQAAGVQDTAKIVDDKIAALKSELPGMLKAGIEEGIKAALNLGGTGGTGGRAEGRALDSMVDLENESADFAVDGLFGNR